MARRTVDPAMRELAVHLVTVENYTLRDAAEQCGVSHVTVERWVKASPVVREAAAARDAEAEAPGDTEPELPIAAGGEFDTIPELKTMLSSFLRSAREARLEGKHREAAALSGHAARLAPTIARLEAAANTDPGAIRISPEERAAAEARVHEMIAAAAARPLLCAHCSRALSLQWGGVTDTPAGDAVTPGEPRRRP